MSALTRPNPDPCWPAQAKTLTEIHAEAHAELGMVPTTMMAPLPGLQGLPALQQPLAGLRHEEVELFPAFKHSGVCLRLCMLQYHCLAGQSTAHLPAPVPMLVM